MLGMPLTIAACFFVHPIVAIGVYALWLCALFILSAVYGTLVKVDYASEIGKAAGGIFKRFTRR
jgi:uncharacterized membrane protein HdeD (DUF308 family)